MTTERCDKLKDFGLLFLRVGLGSMMIIHGWGKITGGPQFWSQIGGAMGIIGINFGHTFWGFMAAFSEVFGGLGLILGLFTRIFGGLLTFTMLVAAAYHASKGDPFGSIAHPLELGIAFVSLALIGPGGLSLDDKFLKGKCPFGKCAGPA